MKAVFLTKIGSDGRPVLPPFTSDEEGRPQLHYNFDEQGIPQNGGYSIVGPIEKGKVIVIVEASPETIAAMRLDTNYEEVSEAKEVAICDSQKIPVANYKKLLETQWASDLEVKAEVIK